MNLARKKTHQQLSNELYLHSSLYFKTKSIFKLGFSDIYSHLHFCKTVPLRWNNFKLFSISFGNIPIFLLTSLQSNFLSLYFPI